MSKFAPSDCVVDGKGLIKVGLKSDGNTILISVKDDGKGIPSDILPKLMQRGETYGKKSGSGLGLAHAKESIELWGGNIEIESELGKGTTLIITLPKAFPPDWFVSELEIIKGSTIVILDDDISIHQLWDGRMGSLKAKENNIKIKHFSMPGELSEWYNRYYKRADMPASAEAMVGKQSTIYLFDYELIGQDKTGLDLIRELNLQDRAILVTSRHEESDVFEECAKLGVKMIPKPMAGFVPIHVVHEPYTVVSEEANDGMWTTDNDLQAKNNGIQNTNDGRQKIDCILIDDDDLIHMSWKSSARKRGKRFVAYFSPDDFFKESDQYDKETLICIDSDLGNGTKGEDVSKKIHEKGFTNIYLATGYNADKFGDISWIKKIIGKSPPWLSGD